MRGAPFPTQPLNRGTRAGNTRLFRFRGTGRLARLWRGSCRGQPAPGDRNREGSMLSRRLFAASAAAGAGASALLAGAARAQAQPAESTLDRIKRTKLLRIA